MLDDLRERIARAIEARADSLERECSGPNGTAPIPDSVGGMIAGIRYAARIARETPTEDYGKSIADAAREYIAARIAVQDPPITASRERMSHAFEKLHWMVDAEKFNWKPADFRSEGDG